VECGARVFFPDGDKAAKGSGGVLPGRLPRGGDSDKLGAGGSTRSFLLLKRESQVDVPGMETAVPVSETFSDYRAVQGVMIAHKRVRGQPGMGTVIFTLRKVRFNTRIPEAVFCPQGRVEKPLNTRAATPLPDGRRRPGSTLPGEG
jgi:hypothetical protein